MTKLENMLEYISKNNEFYRKIIDEEGITNPLDIVQYPILTRQQLQKNRYNMFSDGYKSKYFDQQLRRQTSSGTSGVPINVYWDENDYYLSTKAIWKRRYMYYGILPRDKRMMFTLRIYEKKPETRVSFHVNNRNNVITVNASSLNNDSYDALIETINRFQPKWLYIQPIVLKQLIEAYKKSGSNPPKSIQYIESVGEMLLPGVKNSAREFFGVPVANMYGSEEMNSIAYECPYGHMHIITENVYVECKCAEGIFSYGEGESIISSITNKAMPLIRYNQSDVISISPSRKVCLCGCEDPIIEIIKGRVRERVVVNSSKNLTEINAFLLNEVMEEANNHFGDKIIGFHFTFYKTKVLLVCNVSLREEQWFDVVRNFVITVLETKLGKSCGIRFAVDMFNMDDYFKHNVKSSIFNIVE